jgi:Cellulose binding domain
MWTASHTQSGESVTAVNEPYNPSIPAEGSVTIGFTGRFTSSDAAPTSFAVNGTSCRG